jgi:hypothetical protein
MLIKLQERLELGKLLSMEVPEELAHLLEVTKLQVTGVSMASMA